MGKLRLLLLSMSFMLWGCGPSKIMMVPELQDTEVVDATKGYVIVQVADTTPLGQVYPLNFLTFSPIDLNESAEVKAPRIEAIKTKSQSTSFFMAELEPKEYSLLSLYTYYSFGDRYISKFYPAGIDLGTFEVKAGELTDLGTLALFIRRRGEDYRYETVRAPAASRLTDMFKERFELRAAGISNIDQPHGWLEDGRDSEYAEGYRRAVSRQVTFGQPLIEPLTGAIDFPGHMGLILRRSPERDWRLEALDEDIRVTTLARVQGSVVALTEFDEFYVRDPASEEWLGREGPPAMGDIVYFTEHAQLGIVAVSKLEDQFVVWVTPGWGAEWTQRDVFKREKSLLDAMFEVPTYQSGPMGDTIAAIGDNLFVVIDGKLFRYNMVTRELEHKKLSGVQSIQVRDDVVSASGSNWGYSKKVSFDRGESWVSVKNRMLTPEVQFRGDTKKGCSERHRRDCTKMVGDPIFLDQQNGFMMHDVKVVDDELTPRYLARTTNGGRQWSVEGQGELPKECSTLVRATASEILVQCFLSGEFITSTDGGVTWDVERSVSDN